MDDKRLFPIVLIVFTNILGAGMILPILPLYAEGLFRGTVFQITLLASSFFAAQFLAGPWLGRLSDRVGRRPVLILSQVGTVLAFILFIFAGDLGLAVDHLELGLPLSGGMLILFAGRILDGITGGNISIAQAYVSDVTPEEHRAQGLGLLQGAFGAGFIFGPALGGVLASFGPVAPFIGAAVITSLTLVLTSLLLVESLPPGAHPAAARARSLRPVSFLEQRPMLIILTIGLLGSLAFSALPSTFSLFADRVLFAGLQDPARVQLLIGLMLAFFGMTQVVTQLALVKRLVKRLGERNLVVLGQAATMLAMLGLGLLQTPLLATLALAPLAFGIGISEPGLQSLVTRLGDERSRGQRIGVYQSSRSLGLIIGPVWAGYSFETFRPQAVFLLGAALILLAFLGALRLLRESIPPPRTSPPGPSG